MISNLPIFTDPSLLNRSQSHENSNNSFSLLNKHNDFTNFSLDMPAPDVTDQPHSDRDNLEKLNNVYDSLVDQDEYENSMSINEDIQQSQFIFRKNSLFKDIWAILIFLLILYSVIISPITIAFYYDVSYQFQIINVCIDFIFICDVIFNFLTPYQDKEGNLVTDLKQIAIRYLSSWLLLDLLSSLPFDIIGVYISYSGLNNIEYSSKLQSLLRISKIMRLGKWLKVIRFIKLARGDEGVSRFFYVFEFNRLFIFAGLFMILIHITCCLWIYIGKIYDDSNNWIVHYNFIDSDMVTLYIASFYFTLYTVLTIGYGDITSINYVERIYNIFFMFIGVILFSFTLTSLSNIFAKYDQSSLIMQRKKLILNKLMKEYNIPDNLLKKIKKTIKHEFKKTNIERYNFIDSLPTSIKNDLFFVIYQCHITKLLFFKDLSREFIIYVLPMLKPLALGKAETLFSSGEYINEMYMIIKGVLSLQMGAVYNNFEISKIKDGSHIGDVMLFLHERSNFDLKTKSESTEVLVISKIDYFKIKMHFNEVVQKILESSMKQMEIYDQRMSLISTLTSYVHNFKDIPSKLKLVNFFLLKENFEKYFYSETHSKNLYDFVSGLSETELLSLLGKNYDFPKNENTPNNSQTREIKIKNDSPKKAKYILLDNIVEKILQINCFQYEIPSFNSLDKNKFNLINKDKLSTNKNIICNDAIYYNTRYSEKNGLDMNILKNELNFKESELGEKNLNFSLLYDIQRDIRKLKKIIKNNSKQKKKKNKQKNSNIIYLEEKKAFTSNNQLTCKEMYSKDFRPIKQKYIKKKNGIHLNINDNQIKYYDKYLEFDSSESKLRLPITLEARKEKLFEYVEMYNNLSFYKIFRKLDRIYYLLKILENKRNYDETLKQL
jgi:hypothetical protein